MASFFQQCVHICVLGHIEGLPTQLTSKLAHIHSCASVVIGAWSKKIILWPLIAPFGNHFNIMTAIWKHAPQNKHICCIRKILILLLQSERCTYVHSCAQAAVDGNRARLSVRNANYSLFRFNLDEFCESAKPKHCQLTSRLILTLP